MDWHVAVMEGQGSLGEKSMLRRFGVGVKRRVLNERGAEAVELAIALPILLMLVLGTVTAGLAFFDKISLNRAAREADRGNRFSQRRCRWAERLCGAGL